MAARGSVEKSEIFNKILATFEGSFSPDGKEIRVPVGDVQIKVTLTAAKDVITVSGSTPAPAAVTSDDGFPAPVGSEPIDLPWEEQNKPTQEEIENTKAILAKLGL